MFVLLRSLRLSCSLFALSSVFLAQSAHSQTAETIKLDTIVIDGNSESATGPVDGYVAKRSETASKSDMTILETPQAVNIIGAKEITDRDAHTLTEAVLYTPGVVGGFEGPGDGRRDLLQVRGFKPLQYLDGLAIMGSTYELGVTKPETYALERIEILKGPASVLYGMSAPGGLLNMVSKRPTQEARGEVVLQGGNHNRLQSQFDISGPLDKEGTLLYRLVGTAREADTQLDFAPDDRRFIAPSFTWKPNDDTSFTFLSQYSKGNGGYNSALPLKGTMLPNPHGELPLSTSTSGPDGNHFRSEYWQLGYVFDHSFNENVSFGQTLRYEKYDDDYAAPYWTTLRDDLRTIDRVNFAYRTHSQSFAVDNRLKLKFDTGPLSHSVLIGIDYIKPKTTDEVGEGSAPPLDLYNPVYGNIPTITDFPYQSSTDARQIGLYIQDVIRYDELTFTAGLRHDWARNHTQNISNGKLTGNDMEEEATTFRIGAAYEFDNGIVPYASYSQSFGLPGGTPLPGTSWAPTTGQQYEVGVRYQIPDADAMITLSAFDLRQQNINSVILNTPYSIQTGEIRVLGVEAEAKANIADAWDITASAAYMDGKITKDEDPLKIGEASPNTPKFMTSLWVDYTFDANVALKGLTLGGGVRYMGAYYSSQWGQVSTQVPAFTLFDAHLKYDFGIANKKYDGLSLNVNAKNIFNKKHVVYATDSEALWGAGRAVTASLAYKW